MMFNVNYGVRTRTSPRIMPSRRSTQNKSAATDASKEASAPEQAPVLRNENIPPPPQPAPTKVKSLFTNGIENYRLTGPRVAIDSIRKAAIAARPPPTIAMHAPNWWSPDAQARRAIQVFDQRHSQQLLRANRVREALRRDPTSMTRETALDESIFELAQSRFFVPDSLQSVQAIAAGEKTKVRKLWKLEQSIWAPRKLTSPGRDFYDTDESKAKSFKVDWLLACERLQLGKKIARISDKLDEPDPAPADTFYHAMITHCELITQMFTSLGCQGAGLDLFSISKNAYLQFVRDLELVDNKTSGQRDQDLQLMFEAANASASKADVYNSRHSLNRSEWVGVLVQLILARYGPTKMAITDAVNTFFEEDMRAKVPREWLHDSNAFRTDFCYLEDVDSSLRTYESSLRNLFDTFAYGKGAIGDAVLKTNLMDVEELFDLIDLLELVDEHTTLREVRLNFVYARMMTIDENTVKGRAKTIQLDFEDFLEFLVRCAKMKALPNDQDLSILGVGHAGQYLQWLEGYPEEQFKFNQMRSLALADPIDQPIGRKVQHFMEWVLFLVRGCASSKEGCPQSISKKEAELFKERKVVRVNEFLEGALVAMPHGGPHLAGQEDNRREEEGRLPDVEAPVKEEEEEATLPPKGLKHDLKALRQLAVVFELPTTEPQPEVSRADTNLESILGKLKTMEQQG